MPSIFDKLNFTDELQLGDVQSADEMTVVPIVGSNLAEIASPQNLEFERTHGYGTMVFRNKDPEKPAVVPAHLQVRGRGAQDHAMSGAGFIKAQKVKSFSDACCIESSQGGMLSASGNELDILPAELRKAFLDKTFRARHEFGKLWDRIRDWLRSMPGIRSGQAHMRYFYDHPEYKKALEDFAAEFEPVPGQIGALIMFNGVPVGIEIMPTAEHWAHYWKLLIRGCYGAELVRLKKSGQLRESTLVLPDIPNDADEAKVKEIMSDFVHNLKTSLIPLLEEIKVKSQSTLSSEDELQLKLIRTDSGGGGDLITKDNKPIYLSMVL